jgi:uncharacterized OB-fold protein
MTSAESTRPPKTAESPVPPKAAPTVTDENRPFWDGARAGRLVMQQCTQCGHIRYPIQALCPKCLSDQCSWAELSGRGTVFAVVVYHQAFNKAWAGDIPYNVVIVQLDEGPRMFSNVVGSPNEQVAVGDPVSVVFEPSAGGADGLAVPRFRRLG